MSDGLLPLNPATIPGGKIEDVEDLIGAGGTPVIRQRLQVTGAVLIEVARVQNVDPDGTEYALVTRNIPQRTATPPTITPVAASNVNVPILAANPARKRACFQADRNGTGVLLLKLGTVAASNSYTAALVPGAYYELPDPVYTGEIDGIWDVASGSVLVTEIV